MDSDKHNITHNNITSYKINKPSGSFFNSPTNLNTKGLYSTAMNSTGFQQRGVLLRRGQSVIMKVESPTLFTAVASEPGGAAALPGHVITGGALGTGAALGTVPPEGARQTG